MAKYFTPATDPYLFICPCEQPGCVHPEPSPILLSRLDDARRAYGAIMRVTSGPRCPAHNAKVGGVAGSEHLTGEAADIQCETSQHRFRMILALTEAGVTRIGIGKTFLHVGVSSDQPSDVIWLY